MSDPSTPTRPRQPLTVPELEKLAESNPLAALGHLLDQAGARLLVGLKQQGKYDTVEKMREELASWEDIGKAIGWAPDAAQHWYEMESRAELKSLRQSLVALRTELDDAREALNSCCACQHDGRGTLTSECEHHQNERERADTAESKRAEAERQRDMAREQRDALANFNPDWDMLAATQESLREHMKARTEAEQALAGLKAWLIKKRDRRVFDGGAIGINDVLARLPENQK